MNIRLVNLEKDLPVINSWYKNRDMSIPDSDTYSKIGYIVDDFCACWLYQTDSKYCLIENVISNPNLDRENKDRAFNLMLETLINTGKELGYKQMLTYSKNESIIKRETEHGFIVTDLKMLYRSLE